MKKILCFMTLMIAVLSVSCSKEVVSDELTLEQGMQLSAVIADETRMQLLGTNNKFGSGDQMLLWGDNTTYQSGDVATLTTYKILANGSSLEKVSGLDFSSNSYIRGVFPTTAYLNTTTASELNSGTVWVRFDNANMVFISDNQSTNVTSGFNNIMVGSTDAEGTVVKFYNVCALVAMKVTNSLSSTITRVTMNNQSDYAACMNGVKQTVTPTGSGVTLGPIMRNYSSSTSQQLSKDISIASGETKTIYFLLPIQSDIYPYKLTFKLYANTTEVSSYTMGKDLVPERSKIYNVKGSTGIVLGGEPYEALRLVNTNGGIGIEATECYGTLFTALKSDRDYEIRLAGPSTMIVTYSATTQTVTPSDPNGSFWAERVIESSGELKIYIRSEWDYYYLSPDHNKALLIKFTIIDKTAVGIFDYTKHTAAFLEWYILLHVAVSVLL